MLDSNNMHPLIPLQHGLSINGKPIPAFRSAVPADKFCYLIAGTHGDEPEGVFVQNALVKWLEHSDITNLLFLFLNLIRTG